MRTIAIVVGVEHYWDEDANLLGPVGDALRMADWLIECGGVQQQDLRVLLSPLGDIDPPSSLSFQTASTDNVLDAVRSVGAGNGEIDRIWFYFSGHGIQDIGSPNAPILLPSDFHPERLWKTVHLNAIDDRLIQTGIPEQIIVMDACRDFAFQLDATSIGNPLPFGTNLINLPAGQPTPYQIRLAAAAPGGTARMVSGSMGITSAFTDSLLAGLRTPGPAMEWDLDAGKYVVRADRLFRHIRDDVAMRLAADPEQDPEAPPAHPELTYRDGSARENHPVLAEFSDDVIPDVPLHVELDPRAAASADPQVRMFLRDNVEIGRSPAALEAGDLLAHFALRPNRYLASASATNYRQEQERYVWSVYGLTRRTINLVRSGDRGDGPATFPGPDAPGGRPLKISSEHTLTSQASTEETGAIEIRQSDPDAVIELANQTGLVLARSAGTMIVPPGWPVIPPEAGILGVRRASVKAPLGGDWALVAPLYGVRQEIVLPGEPTTSTPLIESVRGLLTTRSGDGGVALHEWLGGRPLGDGISFISGVVDLLVNPQLAPGISRALGLRADTSSFDNERSKAIVLASYDYLPAKVVVAAEELRVEISGENGTRDTFLISSTRIPELSVAESSVDEGIWPLRIIRPDQPSIDLVVPMLNDHVTVVILHVDAVQGPMVLQYMIPFGVDVPTAHHLEMLQRYILTGQLRAARSLCWEAGEQLGPTEIIIGAILASEFEDSSAILEKASRLAEYPSLRGDSLVYRALALEQSGSPVAAMASYLEACGYGLPVTARALALLYRGGRRLGLKDPLIDKAAAADARQARGTLWTASWTAATGPERTPEKQGVSAGNSGLGVPAIKLEPEPLKLVLYARA